MERLTTKCATIVIATGDETLVYHSLEEVPDNLREQLLETTQGMNSATILIADKGGREELLQAMRRTPPERYARLVSALIPRKNGQRIRKPKWFFLLPALGRMFLVGSLGYVLWVLATLR